MYVHVHVVTVTGASPHAGIAADHYNKRPIANNGLIIARSDDVIRLVCASNSSQPDVGEITGLDGSTLTSGSGWDVNNGGNVPGCILATNTAFTATDQGIYTCIINPRRACAARVTVVVLSFCLSVCLSLCLSVTTFSAATRNKMANKRY